MKARLDNYLLDKGLAPSRSQAASLVKMGRVRVNGTVATKPGQVVSSSDKVITEQNKYVSRAALKLASVAKALELDFSDKTVLDVGSSTGGFTDYALQHGAKKVYAVDVGTMQLHPSLRNHPRIELHEKTDIRDFSIPKSVNLVLIDVSFISIRKVLPHLQAELSPKTNVVAMVKPQFEAESPRWLNRGIVKNSRYRRDILKDFEKHIQGSFTILAKQDSTIAGEKGNVERFYLLELTR